MNQYERMIKRGAAVVCVCCLICSLVFLVKIQEQERQIQTLQDLQTETERSRLQSEEENTRIVSQLKEELAQTAQEPENKRKLQKSEQAIEELEERIPALQSYYDKGVYLDSLAAQMDRENGSKSCIERYFKIEKGELEEILGKTEVSDQLKADFPDADKWGYLLAAGDGIWVQYDVEDSQNALPKGVVIQNPLLDIGYQDARAGMYVFDIEERYPDSAVEEARLEWGTIRYLRYADDEFVYYYVAIDDFGDAVMEYIVPNNGGLLRGSENGEERADRQQPLASDDSAALLEEQEIKLSGLDDEQQLLQIKWDIQKLLKEKEADSTDPRMIYEKYFRLKQGELARIEGIENLDTCGKLPFLNSHFGGVTFGMDESVWVQYRNDCFGGVWEYLTPGTIVIMDAAPHMGFMGTLAGKDFSQIQQNLYETKIQEGFIYNEEMKVYYLQYGDEYYEYIFVSDYEDGRDSYLLIKHTWRDVSSQMDAIKVQTEKKTDSDHSIYDKDYYDSYGVGKIMYIRFQEENLQQDLEDYFEVGNYAEGPEILADMFLDKRTCEMTEKELKDLFYRHGYVLYLHHKIADGLHIRLIEVQEMDGLSLYPIRVAIQTWDEEKIYLEDITAPIPRKIRDFLIIEEEDALRMVIHSSGVSVNYEAEEELSFWEFGDNGRWDLTPMELEMDTSHAHNTGDGYLDLDRDELFPMVCYRDGITFGVSRQGNMSANGIDTFRLGKMEETEKNKSFRLYGIYDNLGRPYVWAYGDCYIQFHIIHT